MKRLILCLALIAAPAGAEEPPAGQWNLFEEGARMLLERFLTEMDPALEALRKELSDLSAFHPPEILPNGDIIIRRKTPVERLDPDESIDL